MGNGDARRPHPAGSGPRVLSIVERIEQKQMAHLRQQSAKLHVREIEAAVDWLDLRKQLESMDLDTELSRLAPVHTAEARHQRGALRCIRGLQSCLRGEVDAGDAEWSEVVAEVPELALPHLLRARWRMQSDPREALVHFDRAAEIEPRDATVYWRRGDCHAKLGDHERALANYRRALTLDPDSIDGLHATGKALVALGRPAEALRYYDQAIARAPRYVDFHEARAVALEVLDEHAAAVRDYDRVLELDPTRLVARFARARCRADLGEVDRAIEELTPLAAENSHAHPLHLLLGKLLLKKEQIAPALDALSRVIELSPGDHEAWGYRALVLGRLGERDRAIADVEHAVELAPDRPEYVYTLLALRHDGRDSAEKIAALEGPIAQFPDTGLFLQERAELHAERGDHERALADWDRLVASWPGDAELRLGRVKALGALQRYPEALEEVSRAIDREPDNAMAYALRANYRDQMDGDDALIAADWERAVALGPDDVAIRYYHGHYRMQKSQYEAAVADFDRFLAIVPTHGEAHYHRACCRYQLDEEHTEDDDWEEDEAENEARYRACERDLERALELGYREEDVFIELHWTHCQLDQPEGSLAALERGIEAHPTCAAFFRLRAEVRVRMKDEEGAAADRARAEQLAARVG